MSTHRESTSSTASTSKDAHESSSSESIQDAYHPRIKRRSIYGESFNPAKDDISDIQNYPKTEEQRQRVMESLRDIFLFRCLDDQQKKLTLNALVPREVKSNEIIIRQGDDGDYFYVVETGIYEAYISNYAGELRTVARYENRGCFGELALMYNEPRAATIKAITDGNLWALNGHNFRRLVLRNAYQKRQHYEALLQTINQLKPLSSYERNIVSDALEPKEYKAGEVIFSQGDEADGMYFVESGEVSVTIKKPDGSQKELCRLGPGKCFGELALVTRKPRAATIAAVGPTKVAFLDANAFQKLLGPCMGSMQKHIREEYKPSTSKF